MVASTLCVWNMGQRLKIWLGSRNLAPHLHDRDSGGSLGRNLLAYEPVKVWSTASCSTVAVVRLLYLKTFFLDPGVAGTLVVTLQQALLSDLDKGTSFSGKDTSAPRCLA